MNLKVRSKCKRKLYKYKKEILTKDSVTITVDAVCYYRTVKPVESITNVSDASQATRFLAATTLRNILGIKSLQEILQEREAIAQHMQVNIFKIDIFIII